MRLNIKVSIFLLSLGLNLNLPVSAQQLTTPAQCYQSVDAAGCLLEMAKQKVTSIKDKNEQASALSKVLTTYANLNRTDFELANRADAASKDKKLELQNFLELQTALATYFVRTDPERAKKHIKNATLVFFEATTRDEPKDRLAIGTWACTLIDGDGDIWKSTAYITAATCTVARLNLIENKEETDALTHSLLKINAAWIQSDYEELSKQKTFFDTQLAKYETLGIKAKSKALNELTQYIKVLSLLMQSEMNRRSSSPIEASKLISQAMEALSGLEKITDSNYSISARIMLANYHNTFFEFEKSIDTLKVIAEKFESKKFDKSIDKETYVDYLVATATALDNGGIKSTQSSKVLRHELQMRQADVLYEHYLYFSSDDKSREAPSKQTIKALHDAAEAGHPHAMHNLAFGHEHGLNGLEKNLTKARYWYYWSAISGYAGAQNNLGDMYEKGQGTPTDIGLAIYWYTQAAMQGEPTAYLSLGELFLNGTGVAQNFFTAGFWLSLASRQLPEGQNKADAIKGRDLAISKLDDKARRQLAIRVYSFVPLKQTSHPLTDRPKLGESL